MKNGILILSLISCVIFSKNASAQEDTREVRKEVQMEKVNDEITLTIKTIDGSKITEEVYTGAEAEKMLAELEKVDEEKVISRQEVKEEINIDEENGVKRLTVRRSENGVETEEVFLGEKADQKIKEIETRSNAPMHLED